MFVYHLSRFCLISFVRNYSKGLPGAYTQVCVCVSLSESGTEKEPLHQNMSGQKKELKPISRVPGGTTWH